MKFTKEKHGTGPIHYSMESDNFVLELYPTSKHIIDNTRLGFEVEEYSQVVKKLDIIEEYEYNSKIIKVVKDPDGRKIELYEK